MEVIKLTTKQETLDALRGGEIKEYAREIRPKTQKKYCLLDEDGYVVDIDGVLQPRYYDVVQFQCGKETCSFKIEDAHIELFEDNDGKLVTYTEDGEEYVAAQIVYHLGKKIKL